VVSWPLGPTGKQFLARGKEKVGPPWIRPIIFGDDFIVLYYGYDNTNILLLFVLQVTRIKPCALFPFRISANSQSMSRDRQDCKVTSFGTDDRGSIPARDFVFTTASKPILEPSYQMGTGGSFPGVKAVAA
jgi:hypothetical protein